MNPFQIGDTLTVHFGTPQPFTVMALRPDACLMRFPAFTFGKWYRVTDLQRWNPVPPKTVSKGIVPMSVEKPDFNQRLLAIAQVEASIRASEAKRQQIYDLILAELDENIAQAKQAAEVMRDSLKADTLRYIAAGGSPSDLHSAVTFSRRTKLVYDRDEVLTKALELNADELVRRKEPELKVREFEAAWKDGRLPWAQVEEVNDPTVAISSKLGDLLIFAEAAQREAG